jgi:hypothetical protein
VVSYRFLVSTFEGSNPSTPVLKTKKGKSNRE